MSKNGNGNGKSVTKKESTLPANFLEQDAVGGLEGVSNEDLATPRLKLLMQLSKLKLTLFILVMVFYQKMQTLQKFLKKIK